MIWLAAILPVLDQGIKRALIFGGQIAEVRNRINGYLRSCSRAIWRRALPFQSAREHVEIRVDLGMCWIPNRRPLFDVELCSDAFRFCLRGHGRLILPHTLGRLAI